MREPDEAQAVPSRRSRAERDYDLDHSYRMSPEVLMLLDGTDQVAARFAANVVALAEMYFREAQRYPGSLDQRLTMWAERHFGRALEPSLAWLMRYQVRTMLAPGQGGRHGPCAGIFRDEQELVRWRKAEASVPELRPGESHLDRAIAICRAAGVEPGPGPRSMPRVPEVLQPAREPGEDG